MLTSLFGFLAFMPLTFAWLPGVDKQVLAADGTDLFNKTSLKRFLPSNKIRGVNLGSLFVFEPWMAGTEWTRIGCDAYKTEFDCVSGLGQTAANKAFQDHWANWITETDINNIQSLGLNTIRIPTGYWMREDIVYADSEHFPQGGYQALANLCGLAKAAGLYIIIDMHGAPGAQQAMQPSTGQNAPTAGFYVDYQYERALKYLEWMTTNIHTNSNFSTVGMIELVNEPIQSANDVPGLTSSFYPQAFSRIRAAEAAVTVPASSALTIQMMSSSWGSGNPNQDLTSDDTAGAAYDNHRYLKYDPSIPETKTDYLSTSCKDVISDSDGFTIVGEFSISAPSDVEHTSDWDPSNTANTQFYQEWFAAQARAYEKVGGWIFWSWKVRLLNMISSSESNANGMLLGGIE
ncbi:MAG: hypothetical protein Q9227_003685 [Pyrenula ochraceoflavens]